MLSYSLGERNILNPAHDVFLAIVFVVSYLLLMRMAKEDLLYRKVLLKSFKYKQRYVAQAYKYSKTHKHYK